MNRKVLTCLMLSLVSTIGAQAPKLTVVIVVDQFSAHFLHMLKPHFSGAFKFLPERGTSYLNAFYDHAMPGTAPGHTLLTTGTFGTFHGIVNNSWFDKEGKKVPCDADTQEHAAVFAPDGSLQAYGKSARNILVDNLTDQMIMHSYPHAKNNVWALSLKSRAAIALAGHLGKALWFDKHKGSYTSSKAYFKELPSWVQEFNKKHDIPSWKTVTWKPFFDCNSPAYNYKHINNYTYSYLKKSMIGEPLPVLDGSYDRWFSKTPQANKLLLDLAVETLNTQYTRQPDERFVLWVSLSSLDKAGHVFGPQSKEVIDLLYHLDHQLQEFIDTIYRKVDSHDVLFILTGDHGAQPIPEIVRDQGLSIARRYHYPNIIAHINKLIEKKYCIKNIIQNFKEPQFYLNQATLAALTEELRQNIYREIKDYMLDLPGIRRAWTFDELQNECFQEYDLDKYLQRQLHKDRSGQVLYALNPYTHLDTYFPEGTKGTAHITQFAFDTQVPLIFYQPGRFEKNSITQNVYMPQVAVSLATLFEVPRPSAATANVLPKLFKERNEKTCTSPI